jgi:hypothetical protein
MKDMKIRSYIIALLASIVVVSCSDDDTYVPAPVPADGCIAAYFDADNESDYILTPEELAENSSITLTVSRKVTDAAVSVPVVVEYKADAFEVPASVDFAAGEKTSKLVIKFPNIENYVNPYLELDGSDRFVASVLVSKWTSIASNVKMYLSQWSGGNVNGVSTYTGEIFWLEGLNKFRVDNFFNSGVDLLFTIVNEKFDISDKSTWNGYFLPTSNVDKDTWGDPYYILTDNSGKTAGWKVGDSDNAITLFSFYDPNSSYSYFNANGNTSTTYGGYAATYVSFEDGTENYYYFYFDWNAAAGN